MSKPKQLTRSGLFICGIAGIVLTVCFVLPESAERIVRSFFHYHYYTQLPVVLSMLVTPIISIGVSTYLIVKCDDISNQLFPDNTEDPRDIERAIYRVALSAVAVLIFAETLPHFIHAFGMTIVEQYEFGEVITNEHTFSVFNAPYLISFVFKLLIGFYLLLGAPHIVEWQMERTEPRKHLGPFQFRLTHLIIAMTVVSLILGLLAIGINFRDLPRY